MEKIRLTIRYTFKSDLCKIINEVTDEVLATTNNKEYAIIICDTLEAHINSKI